MYTHGTTSPFPSTSDRLLAVTIDDTSHLAATLVQEVPADSGNFPWYMTDSIAVLEDSYSEVVVYVIDLALNWQLFSDVVYRCAFVTVFLCKHELWKCTQRSRKTFGGEGGGLYSRLIAYSNISPPPTLGWM